MKRIVLIVLLPVLLFSTVGYFPIFKLQQFQIQETMEDVIKKSVPENQLQIITVSNQNKNEFELSWDEKEFTYKGKRYDVVRSENVKNKVRYYCICDDQETTLFARLDAVVKKEMNDDRTSSGCTAKNLAKMFLQIYIPTKECLLPIHEIASVFNSSQIFFLSSVSSQTSSPPPKSFGIAS